MSRVGKNPIAIPQGVSVTFEGNLVKVTGKTGTNELCLPNSVVVTNEAGSLVVKPSDSTQRSRVMWGTVQSLLKNAVQGAEKGFEIELEITGVGYRAQMEGQKLLLQLGYSHPIEYAVPAHVEIATPKPTQVIVRSASRQLAGQVAAEICAYRPTEPYKGKGVKPLGKFVLRKEGKKK